MADSCQEEIALLTPALRRGSAEFSSCLGGEFQDSGRGFGYGLHLATVDQAEIRGLVTTGHSVRRGAASDFLSSVTLNGRAERRRAEWLIARVEDSPYRGPFS
jgi:hypothetical protein